MKLKELIEKRNVIEAEIDAIEGKIQDENTKILYKEVCDLRDGVGGGYIEGDYYADTRYYSKITGVKNIRIFEFSDGEHNLQIKVLGQKGYLLPDKITVRGVEYVVEFTQSKNYCHGLWRGRKNYIEDKLASFEGSEIKKIYTSRGEVELVIGNLIIACVDKDNILYIPAGNFDIGDYRDEKIFEKVSEEELEDLIERVLEKKAKIDYDSAFKDRKGE